MIEYKINTQEKKHLTQEELQRLFSVIKSKRDKAMFGVTYRFGLRISKAGLFLRDNVDFDRDRIYTRLRLARSSCTTWIQTSLGL